MSLLVLPPLLGLVTHTLLQTQNTEFRRLTTLVTEVFGAMAAVSGALGWVVRDGKNQVQTLEEKFKRAEAVRADRIKELEAQYQIPTEQELEQLRHKERAARLKAEEAHARLQDARKDVEELHPGRRLFRFIAERRKSADYEKHLGIIHLIHKDFQAMSELLTAFEADRADAKGRRPIDRIIFYIDDLDRCRPDRVVEVLEAVHLLLALPLFVVVVGVDPRWLRHCLFEQHPALRSAREGGPAEMEANPSTPQNYLEKIFQIPFALRPVNARGYRRLVSSLAGAEGTGVDHRPGASAAADAGDAGAAVSEAAGSGAQAGAPGGGAAGGAGGAAALVAAEPTRRQLVLSAWETRDLQAFWPLFQTPRSIKRFINIYRLVRAGIYSSEFDAFSGTAEKPGDYQVVMTLLAVVTGFPSVATQFLEFLEAYPGRPSWSAVVQALRSGPPPAQPPPPGPQPIWPKLSPAEEPAWKRLSQRLQLVRLDHFAPDLAPFRRWAPHVERYSFSADLVEAS